jgi:hypothetical protein
MRERGGIVALLMLRPAVWSSDRIVGERLLTRYYHNNIRKAESVTKRRLYQLSHVRLPSILSGRGETAKDQMRPDRTSGSPKLRRSLRRTCCYQRSVFLFGSGR